MGCARHRWAMHALAMHAARSPRLPPLRASCACRRAHPARYVRWLHSHALSLPEPRRHGVRELLSAALFAAAARRQDLPFWEARVELWQRHIIRPACECLCRCMKVVKLQCPGVADPQPKECDVADAVPGEQGGTCACAVHAATCPRCRRPPPPRPRRPTAPPGTSRRKRVVLS